MLALRRKQLLGPARLRIAGAILTGWIYLALVEYAAGMEIFRLVLIFFAIEDRKVAQDSARACSCGLACSGCPT